MPDVNIPSFYSGWDREILSLLSDAKGLHKYWRMWTRSSRNRDEEDYREQING